MGTFWWTTERQRTTKGGSLWKTRRQRTTTGGEGVGGGVVVEDKETKDDVHVCGRCGGRQIDKERRKVEHKETKDDERVCGRGLEFVVGYKG